MILFDPPQKTGASFDELDAEDVRPEDQTGNGDVRGNPDFTLPTASLLAAWSGAEEVESGADQLRAFYQS